MGYLKTAVGGITWMAGLRGVTRGLAVVKIAIIARILLPSQFGLYAIALLVLGFLETLTETGINIFLIQEKDNTDEYVNSAWVVSIARGILIALLIVLASPFIVSFFNVPDAIFLLYLVALVAFIRGFINPSEVKFQKNLMFNKEFYFKSSLFLIDTLVAVSLALIIRNESSLVLGMAVSAFVEVIASFIIFSPKPRLIFDLEKVKKVFNRGKWITGAGALNYAFRNLDNVVVGKVLGASPLGLYQQAYTLSTLPVSEIGEIFNRVTFPVYVDISQQAKRLKEAFTKTTLAIIGLVIPFGALLFVFSKEVVLILLGENWLGAVPALRILALFGVVKAIHNSFYSLLLALKKQEILTLVEFISILGLAIPLVPLTLMYGLTGTAWAVVIGGIVSVPVLLYYLWRLF